VLEGTLQAVGVGVVADDQGDFDTWELLVFDGVDEGLQVGART
jgi:hypothetical protein